jgi:hypothetical protein
MLRVFATIVLPLVLPTALYLLWVRVANRPARGESVGWAALPWLWLAGAGALLLAGVLFVVIAGFGTSTPGRYVAPSWENGRIIPGHIEPRPIEPGHSK